MATRQSQSQARLPAQVPICRWVRTHRLRVRSQAEFRWQKQSRIPTFLVPALQNADLFLSSEAIVQSVPVSATQAGGDTEQDEAESDSGEETESDDDVRITSSTSSNRTHLI